MAPVQPAASVVATGLGIRYVGSDPTFAYAYSGQLDDFATYTTGLEFTTGSGIIKGIFQFDALTQVSNITSGDLAVFKILLNDLALSITKLDAGPENQPPTVEVPIILPPLTKVEVQYQGNANSADYPTFLRFTGRVYGAE